MIFFKGTYLTKEKGTGGLYWKYIQVSETYMEQKIQKDQLRTFFLAQKMRNCKNIARMIFSAFFNIFQFFRVLMAENQT